MPNPTSLSRYLESMGKTKEPSCYACGGMVDAHGKAFGGEVSENSGRHLDEVENAVDEANAPDEDEDMPMPDMDEDDEDTHKAKFVSAILKKKGK
jgi:hypothetical protein